MATGIKRVLPDRIVFTYQGDGDLASIGMGEIVHAAARGENITVIFINNANYGMTGGQMAPTTLPGMKTTSSPNGRDVETQGYPIRMAEMLSTLDGAGYVVRRSLHDPKNIRLAKKAIRMAFETQVRGLGFSMVELLSTCPTNWGMTPGEVAEVRGRADGGLLSAGRLQGHRGRCSRSRFREVPMQKEIIIAGFGGQGVLFAGQVLAYAAMDAGQGSHLDPLLRPRNARRHGQLHRRHRGRRDRLAAGQASAAGHRPEPAFLRQIRGTAGPRAAR